MGILSVPIFPILMQKQSPEVFYKKKVFLKISQVHWKTPVPESLFQ